MKKSLWLGCFAAAISGGFLWVSAPAESQSAGSFVAVQGASPGTAQVGNTNITGTALSDRVGVGTTSVGVGQRMHVMESNATGNPNFGSDDFVLESAGTTTMTVFSGTNFTAGVRFQNGTANAGGIMSNRPGNEGGLSFETGNSAPRLVIDAAGLVGIDVATPATKLDVQGDVTWRNATARLGLLTNYGSFGGAINLFEDDGTIRSMALEPDANGVGGYITVYGSGFNGLYLDGNILGTGSPALNLIGTTVMTLDASATGNSSVVFGQDAISAAETLDEPGVGHGVLSGSLALTGSYQPVVSKTITVPAAGHVIVWGSLFTRHDHVNGTPNIIISGVSDFPTSLDSDDECAFQITAAAPTGTYNTTASPVSVFPVPSAGTYTFYLVARESQGTAAVFDRHLVCLYVATAYGTVERPSGGNRTNVPDEVQTSSELDELYPPRSGLTPKELKDERQQEVRRHLKKLEEEQQKVLEQIKKLRSSVGNQ